MNDEAATSYTEEINQMTNGAQFLMQELGNNKYYRENRYLFLFYLIDSTPIYYNRGHSSIRLAYR